MCTKYPVLVIEFWSKYRIPQSRFLLPCVAWSQIDARNVLDMKYVKSEKWNDYLYDWPDWQIGHFKS